MREVSPVGSTSLFYYRSSMVPTFAPGDLLTVRPYDSTRIRPGDVIVFRSPESGDLITHRVVEAREDGLVTCGDNPDSPVDPWILSPAEVVGRVESVERGGRVRRVWGGSVGLASHRIRRHHARLCRLWRRAISAVLRRCGLGMWLARLALWRVLPPSRRPRVLAVRRPCGTELLLVFGAKVIGRAAPSGRFWSIRFLYLPFVDRAFLRRARQEFVQQ